MARKNRDKEMEGKNGKTDADALHHPLHGKQQNYSRVRAAINKTLSDQARLQTTIKTETLRHRRARTRTLIQAGGLLNLSGLLQICQIEEGDDLQLNFGSLDKAAVLLGILLDTADAISDPPDAGQMEAWRELGTRLLKQRAAQMTYQKMRHRIPKIK